MSRRKAIFATFFGLALISFGAGLLIDLHFSQNSPTKPRPEEGRINAITLNRVTVYVTDQELIVTRLPVCSFFVWFGAVAYFGVRWKLIKFATKQPDFSAGVFRKKKANGG
jgi:hypothetical protein